MTFKEKRELLDTVGTKFKVKLKKCIDDIYVIGDCFKEDEESSLRFVKKDELFGRSMNIDKLGTRKLVLLDYDMFWTCRKVIIRFEDIEILESS